MRQILCDRCKEVIKDQKSVRYFALGEMPLFEEMHHLRYSDMKASELTWKQLGEYCGNCVSAITHELQTAPPKVYVRG